MKIAKFIQKSPLMPIIMAGKELKFILEEQLNKSGLNIVDGLVLVAIFSEERSARPSEIAQCLQLSRSQVSQALTRLERAQLIERSLAKGDMRVWELRVTASGKHKSQRVIKAFDELTRKIEINLGRDKSEEMAPRLLGLRKSLMSARD